MPPKKELGERSLMMSLDMHHHAYELLKVAGGVDVFLPYGIQTNQTKELKIGYLHRVEWCFFSLSLDTVTTSDNR